jgi:hypothetical protein
MKDIILNVIFLCVIFLNVLLPNATHLNAALQNDILVNVLASFKLIFHLALISLTFSLKVLKKSNWFVTVTSKFYFQYYLSLLLSFEVKNIVVIP